MLKTTLKTHRTALRAGTLQPQKVFAMLKLAPAAEAAHARPPLALCLVVDTSTSMRLIADQEAATAEIARRGLTGTANPDDGGGMFNYDLNMPVLLDLAIQAAHAMVDDSNLRPADRISIIQFDDECQTLIPLTPVSQKEPIHAAIESLRNFTGETCMEMGLYNSLNEMRSLPPEVAKRVMVFTDGATHNEAACREFLPKFAALNAPLIGIGFGQEYNETLLRQMADATQGRPYALKSMEDLAEVLQTEVEQTTREVVTDLKTTINTVKGVQIDSINRVHPGIIDVNTQQKPYRLGNIPLGAPTVFIIEMTVSGIERPPSRARIAQVVLTANAPGLNKVQEFAPLDVFIEFSTDSTATAAVDPEIVGYVQQKNVGNMVEEAVRDAQVDPNAALKKLKTAVSVTEGIGNKAATQMLQEAICELDHSGSISAGTYKTVALGLRTRTVRTSSVDDNDAGGLSAEEIRRLTGT